MHALPRVPITLSRICRSTRSGAFSPHGQGLLHCSAGPPELVVLHLHMEGIQARQRYAC